MTLESNLNNLNQGKFISLFGVIFEKTEWIAEKLFELKPFKDKNDLINKMIQMYELSSNSEVLNISVNGLVCDFCARSIEKIFSKKESVESININLEKMLITINLKKGKNLDDNTIKQLINDSGYDVREINRDN